MVSPSKKKLNLKLPNFVNISEGSENVTETLKNGHYVMRKHGFQ